MHKDYGTIINEHTGFTGEHVVEYLKRRMVIESAVLGSPTRAACVQFVIEHEDEIIRNFLAASELEYLRTLFSNSKKSLKDSVKVDTDTRYVCVSLRDPNGVLWHWTFYVYQNVKTIVTYVNGIESAIKRVEGEREYYFSSFCEV